MVEREHVKNKLGLLLDYYKKLKSEIVLKHRELESCKLECRKVDSSRAECYNTLLVRQQEVDDRIHEINEKNMKIRELESSAQDCYKAVEEMNSKIQAKFVQIDEFESKVKIFEDKSREKVVEYIQLAADLRDIQLKLENMEDRGRLSDSLLAELESEKNLFNKKLTAICATENDAMERRTKLQTAIDAEIARLDTLNREAKEAEEVIEQLNMELSLLQAQANEITESSRKAQAQLGVMRTDLHEA